MWIDRKGESLAPYMRVVPRAGEFHGQICGATVLTAPTLEQAKANVALKLALSQWKENAISSLIWKSGHLIGAQHNVYYHERYVGCWLGFIDDQWVCYSTTSKACERMLAVEYLNVLDRLSEPFVNDSRQASADRATQDEGVSRVD